MRDITIGQYFPGKSPLHRMDPRTKLILVVAYVVMLFLANNLWALLVSVVFLAVVYPISGVPIKMSLRSVRTILPIILFTAILNMFFVDGNILWQWGFIKITDKGILMMVLMTLRILCLIIGTSLLTFTTSPISLTDGIEQLFGPLKKLHLPVHEVAMMMTIALRFIPTLIEETDKIMSAQKARGADMESGNLIQRIKALIPILIPLFVSAFRRADDLALALESRCYHGGEGRTRMTQLKMSSVDVWGFVVMALALGATIAANQFIHSFVIR
ncbi:MAG: energy-coupling factor transporter transmembrane component T family protein [Oscillospiraceae bacterium]